MRAESLPKDASGWLEYDSILTLSHDMENTIALYEPGTSINVPVTKRVSRKLGIKLPNLYIADLFVDHRSFVLCMLHNKLLRLHRPAFIRSTRLSHYTESRERCLNSAGAICEMLSTLKGISAELVSGRQSLPPCSNLRLPRQRSFGTCIFTP